MVRFPLEFDNPTAPGLVRRADDDIQRHVMMNLRLRLLRIAGLAICALSVFTAAVNAQESGNSAFGDSPFSIVGAFDDQAEAEPVTFTSRFAAPAAGQPAILAITAKIAPGWHVYSLTQPAGGPQKTTIEVDASPQYKLLSPFRAHPEPKKRIDNEIWVGLEIQEHADEVTWFAPIALADGVDPAKLEIRGKIDLQVCKESCIPIEQSFAAKLGDVDRAALALQRAGSSTTSPMQIASLTGPTSEGTYRAEDSDVEITGRIVPGVTRAQDGARLEITARPSAGWHVYAYAERDDKPGSKPTLIAFEGTSGLKLSQPTTDAAVIEEDMSHIGFGMLRYHKGAATWTVDIKVPDDAKPGDYTIAGIIGYQACESLTNGQGSCELPKAARFRGTLSVGDTPGSVTHDLTFAAASYSDAGKVAAEQPFLRNDNLPAGNVSDDLTTDYAADSPPADSTSRVSLFAILGAALLGGLILNVMPCVLPVIGLKIMSFAEQGGESRRHIFALNLAYAAGLIGVFVVLATLASLAQLGLGSESFGWGELYTLLWFKVGMTALVFAMALSFLGVWEIPIPGFASSGTATKLATREGYYGALFKGMFTTILATPCSGPFLGPVFGYTLAQPPWVTYLIFLFVGIGMAAPYLIIGAFPSLIHKLPRPGAWMETFKQLMGFVLLGTVVYLFSTIGEEYFIATLALLVGIWFACWWIGRTPLTAPDRARYTAWIGGIGTAALVGWASFMMLTPSEYELPWQPYTPAALSQARAEGKTVLVDFTADWCPTCKANLKFSLNQEDVHELVNKNGVVALVADWTDRNPIIKQALAELGSRSIPLLAIYPADPEREPIVLPDVVSSGQVIEALENAGPSRPAASGTVATMGATSAL